MAKLESAGLWIRCNAYTTLNLLYPLHETRTRRMTSSCMIMYLIGLGKKVPALYYASSFIRGFEFLPTFRITHHPLLYDGMSLAKLGSQSAMSTHGMSKS